MPEDQKKRLTDNQRRLLSLAMERYDLMLWELITKAKDADSMIHPEEKLSNNNDFKKKALAYHFRFEEYLKKNNLIIPIFIKASKSALCSLDYIVPGQSRSHVRHYLNCYRCVLLHTMETDLVNVIYSCKGMHPAVYPEVDLSHA